MTYFMPGEKNANEMFNYYMEGVIKRNQGIEDGKVYS